jgi:hypothetical protein
MSEPDWADKRAREWLDDRGGLVSVECLPSLVVLLREVAEDRAAYSVGYADAAAELRRVVEERRKLPLNSDRLAECDEILRRLGLL